MIDISVVTYSGELKLGGNRDSVMALPGATEVHARTLPLGSSNWTITECSFAIPTGTNISERFDALLGFLDPLPEYISIFWRKHPVLEDHWHPAKWLVPVAGL